MKGIPPDNARVISVYEKPSIEAPGLASGYARIGFWEFSCLTLRIR